MGWLHDLSVHLWPRLPLSPRWRARLIWLLRPKFIVGVEALIEDDSGRVLIGRHSYRHHRPWGPLGGSVEAEEPLATALRREVREECGLEVEVGPVVALMRGREPRRLDVAFRCRVIGGELSTSAEIPEVRWCTPAELDRLLAPEDRWFIDLVRRAVDAPVLHDVVVR